MSTGHARFTRLSRLAALLALTVTVLLTRPPAHSLAQQQSMFVATGRAKLGGRLEAAQRRALENALWLVVEQAVHSVVPAEARLEHRQAINAILAGPRQHVTNYEVIQRGPSRGYFIVKVRATVAMVRLVSQLRAQAVPVNQMTVQPQQTRVVQSVPTTAPMPAAAPADPVAGQDAPPAHAAASTPRAAAGPTLNATQSQASAATAQTSPQPTRPRIAILLFQLGFTNPQWAQNWDISLGVTELVEEALHGSGRYRIVERRQIEQILKEQGFGTSGSVNAATAAKIGRILGVQRLVMGSVNQFDLKGAAGFALPRLVVGLYRAQVDLTSRVVDTSTAEIVTIVRGSGRADGAVALAQLEGLTFGGGEFRQSVLGKALDQAIQELVAKLNGSMSGQ